MAHYIDKNGTKVFMDSDMNDKDLTETINSSKTAEAIEKQNSIYAKELKNNHVFNKWTIIISAISALAAVASAIISICK